MSVTKRGKFYHYRFNSQGKRYSGVCRDADGHKVEYKKDALAAEQRVRRQVAKLEAQKSVKGIVENFKRELAGGEPVALGDAWPLFCAKPRKKPMSPRHKEQVESRWRDFVYYMADHYPDARSLHQVSPAMAEAYVSFLDASGPYANFHLAPTAKALDLPVTTLKTYMKAKDWPETGKLEDMKAFVARKIARLSAKHKAKRRHYSAPVPVQLSSQARNNYLTTCAMIFRTLAKDAGCPDNPFADIAKIDSNAETREAFTPDELKLIAENASGWIYDLFMVGINTGLREGDICTLRWHEVDLGSGWITRRMNKTGKAVQVPIMPALKKHLAALPRDSEYCFPELAARYTKKRTTIGVRVREFLESLDINTTRRVKGRTRSISIKDVHSCRHTFVYLAAIHNIPLPVVQAIVGHVSEGMTKKYSNHAQREQIAASMAKVPDYMTNGGGKRIASKARCERVLEQIQGLDEGQLEKVESFVATL